MTGIKTVAIVGGGPAGLAAGCLLAREGVKVQLFEANPKLGGSCANTCLQGYTFNDGALGLVLIGALERLFQQLGLNRATLLPMRKITATTTAILDDGARVTLADGLDVHIEGGAGRTNAAQVHDELERLVRRWQPALRFYTEDFLLRPFSRMRLMAKGWRYLPLMRGNAADQLKRAVSDATVRAALGGLMLAASVPLEQMPALSLVLLAAMLIEGYHLPVGGMGRITEVLGQCLADRGGEIHLGAPVQRIVVENGRVCGVEVAGHDRVAADAVLSTTSGMQTFGELVPPDAVPPDLRRKVERAPLSDQAFSVQLGLANRVEAQSFITNVVPYLEEQHRLFMPGTGPLRWICYYVPTVFGPELAPPGGSVVEAFPFIAPAMATAVDDWDDVRKAQVAEATLRVLSRFHQLDVMVQRVRSPKDFRDDMHLYRGTYYGLSPAAGFAAYFPHRTGLPGLYQCGQTTHPGAGVVPAAVSGLLAARAMLQI